MRSDSGYVPAGWPRRVPPPGAPGWQEAAVEWLLDACPAEFRGYRSWRRHPAALAWLAAYQVQSQVDGLREAWRHARVDLTDVVGARALPGVLTELEREGLRLRELSRAVEMVRDALGGKEFVAKL